MAKSPKFSWYQQLFLAALVVNEQILPIRALRGASPAFDEEPRCFISIQELRLAVQQYQGQDMLDEKLASTYGWPMNHWCVSNLYDFSNLFQNWDKTHPHPFNEPLDQWDMSLARDLSGMFQNCHEFNQDLSHWDVSEVTSMSRMFASAKNFQQDLGNWDTAQLRDASYMFLHAHSYRGHRHLNAWDIRSLQTAEGMFRDAREMDPDQLHWDLDRIPNTHRMFSDAVAVSVAAPNMMPQNITEPDSIRQEPDPFTPRYPSSSGLRIDPAEISMMLRH